MELNLFCSGRDSSCELSPWMTARNRKFTMHRSVLQLRQWMVSENLDFLFLFFFEFLRPDTCTRQAHAPMPKLEDCHIEYHDRDVVLTTERCCIQEDPFLQGMREQAEE